MTGSSEKTVVDILKDAVHGYGELIPDSELEALSVFVVDGQIDMDRYIDRKTGKAKGDHARGARIYQTVCIKCHASDGKLMNFGDEKNPEYVGTWATENPWATLHKIRMGQPGQVMPSMIAFRIQAQVDLLAHAQTLPIREEYSGFDPIST